MIAQSSLPSGDPKATRSVIALSKTIIDQDLQLNRTGLYIFKQMILQELQNKALKLSNRDRWQLVQVLLESLKQEAHPKLKRGYLSRLRGIAKTSTAIEEVDPKEDYITYLTEKYQ